MIGPGDGAPDVAVIGGGIVGCALAAFLAEAGARVRLYEREAIAAAASGHNSGVLEHPLDEALVELYRESLEHYAALGHGFPFPAEAAGVLVVSEHGDELAAERARIARRFPELAAETLDGAELARAEPALAGGLAAFRLDTGRPVPPAAATEAFAQRARAAGAEVLVGAAATADVRGDRVAGVVVDGRTEPAGAVVVAAGPWTPEAAARDLPIAPLWGVVVELRLDAAPRHVLEEAGVEELVASGGPPQLFSLVTAAGASSLGSTFLVERPDPATLAPILRERGARFVPAVADAPVTSLRACPRPRTPDGRPLLGPLPGVEGLFVAAGHGPWGITLGPASARLVADAVLGRDAPIPAELAAGRFATTAPPAPDRLAPPRR